MNNLAIRYAKLAVILLIIVVIIGLLFYLPLSRVKIKEGENYIVNSSGSLVNSTKIKSGFNNISVEGPYVKTSVKAINIPFITSTINNNFKDNVSLESIAYRQLIENNVEPGTVNSCQKFENYWVICNHYTSSVEPFYMNYIDKNWVLYYQEINPANIANIDARNFYNQLLLNNQTYADY